MTKKKKPNDKNLERFLVKIVKRGEKFSVEFPKKITDQLKLNPKKDKFLFLMDKKNLNIGGFVVDMKVYNEKDLPLRNFEKKTKYKNRKNSK